MGFRAYTAPTDPRWNGSQRLGPFLLLPITALFIIAWILFIADQVYSSVLGSQYKAAYKVWIETSNYNYNTMPQSDVEWSLSSFLFRSCMTLIPELIHLPLMHFLLHKNKLHPVAALSTGLIFAILWLFNAVWTILMVDPYFTEHYEINTYERLVQGSAAICVLIDLCYLIYVVCACVAVSRWRKARKDAAAYRKGLHDGIELAGGVARENGDTVVHDEEPSERV